MALGLTESIFFNPFIQSIMKTTLVLSVAFALFGSAAASAQTTAHHHAAAKTEMVKPITPPDPVMSAFQSKFSGATPTWQMTPAGNYCAVIDNSGQKVYAEYGPDGKWLRTRTDMTQDQLPDLAKNAIQSKYPGMEVAGIQKLEYDSVNPFYRVDLKQGDQVKSVMVNDAGYVSE